MFTVHTHHIAPNPLLQPFVRCFALRSFDTGGAELPKPLIADSEMTIAFFIRSNLFDFRSLDATPPCYSVPKNGLPIIGFTGIQTHAKGFFVFKGGTSIFNIHFKPVGFYSIFNFQPRQLADTLGGCADLFAREILLLQEQLQEAASLSECVSLAEPFLLKKLFSHRPKYRHAGIGGASGLLVRQNGLYAITKLAADCNMTLQTFEVQFTEQVGVHPKLFARLLRFKAAVDLKLYQPFQKWTAIANRCGYFDQTHFIKEFREFASVAPGKFIQTLNPLLEDFEADD